MTDLINRLRMKWRYMGPMRNREREEAADEIETLIRELQSARKICQRELDRVCNERDLARILYCDKASPSDPHKIADKWGWDCFKNDKETFWDAIDRIYSDSRKFKK
jgi:hypothetical protein